MTDANMTLTLENGAMMNFNMSIDRDAAHQLRNNHVVDIAFVMYDTPTTIYVNLKKRK